MDYHIYQFEDEKNQVLESVRKFDFLRGLPGGWLEYSPPRKVVGYGDGSLYTDQGKKYGDHWEQTSWSGSTPATQTTAVTNTGEIPPHFIKTGILKGVRDALKHFGAEVDDTSGTGLWCNYYTREGDIIAGHTDDENYYQRNYGKEPLFVSLTLFEDGKLGTEGVARFQIKVDGKWKEVKLGHLSLLVMSGGIEHRVMKYIGGKFRKRYNITFRTPVKREEDIIKNYRFFSNFGRYYRRTCVLYVPKKCFADDIGDSNPGDLIYDRNRNICIRERGGKGGGKEEKKEGKKEYKMISDGSYYEKVLKGHSRFNDRLIVRLNLPVDRKELMEEIRKKYGENIKSPPVSTTSVSLNLMLKD